MDGADEFAIVGRMIFKKVRRMHEVKVSEPSVHHFINSGFVKRFNLVIIINPLLDFFADLWLPFNKVLLQSNSLGDCVAPHGFLLHLFKEGNTFGLCFNLFLPDEIFAPLSNSIHKLRFHKVVILVELKAFMED